MQGRWVILSESVLYYFEGEKESSPKGLVPLENVVVRKLDEKKSDRPFAFALSSSEEEGAVLKDGEGDGKGGSLTQGNHTSFVVCSAASRRTSAGGGSSRCERACSSRASGPQRPTSRVRAGKPSLQ